MFDYTLKQAHGKYPAGTKAKARRNDDRDIVLTFEDGNEITISAASYCLMGEDIEALPWLKQAVEGLAELSGRPQEDVRTELLDLAYALQVNAGRATNNPRWQDREHRQASVFRMLAYANAYFEAVSSLRLR